MNEESHQWKAPAHCTCTVEYVCACLCIGWLVRKEAHVMSPQELEKMGFLLDVVGIYDICIYLSFIVWLYITYVFIQDWGAITSSIIAFLVWCIDMMPWWLWHIPICPNFLCNLYCMFFLARNTMICWYILLFGTSTHFHICHKSSGKLQVVLFETTLWEDVVLWLLCMWVPPCL